jgi:hypothetical protein
MFELPGNILRGLRGILPGVRVSNLCGAHPAVPVLFTLALRGQLRALLSVMWLDLLPGASRFRPPLSKVRDRQARRDRHE